MKYIVPILFLTLSLSGCGKKESASEKSSVKVVNNKWKGEWKRDISTYYEATLTISSIDNDSIEFSLFALSGGNSGELEGKASYNDNLAVYSATDEDYPCLIEFKLFGDSVIISQIEGQCGAGMGVSFEGTYVNSKLSSKKVKHEENLIELGILQNNKEDSLFRSLVGKAYSLFVNSTQITYEEEDIDSLGAKAISSDVRGTSMHNIVMIDSLNNIWAAVTTDDDKVLYFTNRKDYYEKLPNTINDWRNNFSEYEIIYKSKE